MEDHSRTSTPSVQGDTAPKKYFIQYSPAGQFGILISMAVVGMVVGNILAIIPFLVKGVPLTQLATAFTDSKYADLMRWSQVIGTFFTFFGPVWAFQKITNEPKGFLKVKTQSTPAVWLLVILLAFASLSVTDLMGDLNHNIPLPISLATKFQQMEDNYNEQVMKLMQMKGIPDLVVSILIVALLPAIVEEVFFRGGLQQVMIRWTKKPFVAILITSVIFSAIHFSYYGFLPRAFLGLVLGYVFYWTKDLKMSILIHFINNLVSVVTFYVLSQKNELTKEKINDSMPWYYQLIGLVLFIGVITVLYKQLKKQKVNTI